MKPLTTEQVIARANLVAIGAGREALAEVVDAAEMVLNDQEGQSLDAIWRCLMKRGAASSCR